MPNFLKYIHYYTEIYTNTCLVTQILNPRNEPPPREEPIMEPDDNGIIQPPFVPPPHRPGRVTNKLQYFHNYLIDVWDYSCARPFRQPVDAKTRTVSFYARKPESYFHINN